MNNRCLFIIAVLVLVLFCCMLSGCTPKPVITQEFLLQECTKDSPLPNDGSGKEALQTLIKYDSLYAKCRILHHNLIEAIRKK